MGNKKLEPIPFDPAEIDEGIKYERTVVTKSNNPTYDNRSFGIRSLRGGEYRAILNKINPRPQNMADANVLAYEACKKGLLNEAIVKRLDDIDADVILQIGSEILEVSKPMEEEVEDFSTQPKVS
jgi:hypothetical protein